MRTLRTWLRDKRRHLEPMPEDLGVGFRALYDCESIGIATLTPEGRFIATNKGFRRMLGYEGRELAGLTLNEVTHRDDIPRCEDEFGRMKRRETDNFVTEKRYIRKDGTPVWTQIVVAAVRERGRLQRTVEVAMDITQRKVAEEKVRRLTADLEDRVKERTAQLEYHAALLSSEQETSPDGIVVSDLEGDRVLSCNKRFVEMWGLPREIAASDSFERMIDHILAQLTAPELVVERLKEVRKNPDKISFLELTLKDGRTIEVSSSPVSGGNSRRYGRIAYCHDVTRRAHAEDRLRQQSEALGRSNVDLDMFAYAAAHDLNAPLRRVIGFGDLLKDRLKDRLDAGAAELLARMQDAAAGMSKLITDVLTLARAGREPLPPEDVDLNLLTTEVVSELRGAIDEAGATVQAGPLPTLRAHSSLLRRVFQNLISNAIKFRGDAPLRVRVESRRTEDGFIEISVADNGIGFEQEDAEKIFEPFVRLHPAGEYLGSGIGLAICRRIVERYGGRISASGEPGKGAVIKLTFPPSTAAGG